MSLRLYWVKERCHLNKIGRKQTIATTVVARVPRPIHTTHTHTQVERTPDQGGRGRMLLRKRICGMRTNVSLPGHLASDNYLPTSSMTRSGDCMNRSTPARPATPQPAKRTPGLAVRLVRAPSRSRHCNGRDSRHLPRETGKGIG